MLSASWAINTQFGDSSYSKKWNHFYSTKNIDLYTANYKKVMLFLANLYHEDNCNLEVIAVLRSAFPTILPRNNEIAFGQDRIVSPMMKEIFKLGLTLPKYTVTYDPDVLLTYISTSPSKPMLALELLSKKLITMPVKWIKSLIYTRTTNWLCMLLWKEPYLQHTKTPEGY